MVAIDGVVWTNGPGGLPFLSVDDPVLARRPRVEKQGSHATVLWNPGRDRARTMRDIGKDGWRGFVCVETANVGPHAVRLAPGARSAMTSQIEVLPLA